MALGITVCLGLMLFSLYRIFYYDIWSYISERKMEKLASGVLIPVEAEVSEEHRIADLIASGLYTEEEAIVKAAEEAAAAENITGADSDILYKYSVLYKRNSDMAGWIQIPGTVVNYPVMLTPDDEEYYLKKGFDKKFDINGIPFMDARCSVAEPTTNFLIYGHNMKNGSMFSALLNYEREDFYKEHPGIRFDTIYETGQYEIVGVFRTQIAFEGEETYRYYQFIQAESRKEYDAYIAYVKENAFYDTGITAEYGTQLLTLSTCDRSIEEGRLVVVARKREGTKKE
ncbi:MAG: class B sortase [Lachnospiraceae bacterium]|nr:class B sortase [Lachnospiraceae bacterium]